MDKDKLLTELKVLEKKLLPNYFDYDAYFTSTKYLRIYSDIYDITKHDLNECGTNCCILGGLVLLYGNKEDIIHIHDWALKRYDFIGGHMYALFYPDHIILIGDKEIKTPDGSASKDEVFKHIYTLLDNEEFIKGNFEIIDDED